MAAVADMSTPTLPSPDQDFVVEFDDKNGPKYMYCQACCLLPLMTNCLILPCLPCLPYCQYKEFKSQNVTITDKQLVYKGGWLNRVSKNIPLDRIQDVTVEEGCIQRCFDVKSVKIQTAGSSNANGAAEASLLAPKNAEMVRDIIMQRRERLLVGALQKAWSSALPETCMEPQGWGDPKYVLAAAVGAAAIPAAGLAAGALVPVAMSTFGTVVPGVGTMHAAGGVAATLQWASTAYVSGTAAAYGAATSAAVAGAWSQGIDGVTAATAHIGGAAVAYGAATGSAIAGALSQGSTHAVNGAVATTTYVGGAATPYVAAAGTAATGAWTWGSKWLMSRL